MNIKKIPNRVREFSQKIKIIYDAFHSPFLLFPLGHYYSPIPSLEDIKQREDKIFKLSDDLLGIDLNKEGQLCLLKAFQKYYAEIPFSDHLPSNSSLRYYFLNDFFSYSDAIILYSMLRHYQSKRIIEVGSGYSSCVILDTNERFLSSQLDCTFIEPYPDRLLSLLNKQEAQKINLLRIPLQEVDLKLFENLNVNDILFVDSTHVAKIGSDVNFLLFEVLPRLNSGVLIHIHDIFYPFEYPKEWIYQGKAWNEAYILRAFLQYNQNYKIEFFNNYIGKVCDSELLENLPLCTRNIGGSLWLRKL